MIEPMATVLIVDDDAAVRTVLGALLSRGGLRVRQAPNGTEALAMLGNEPVDLVVTDLRMPGMSGMELLDEIVARWGDIPVIVLTAHGTVALAVEAMKAGATDFVLKPFDREEILYVVKKALLKGQHAEDRDGTSREAVGGGSPHSSAMKAVDELISRAAQATATVLLRGESGTGKEVAARAIHERGPRKKAPFIKLHCAALPETLLESELFGYEKGAFTGAVCRKPGRVELADCGTLLLDEIGDISASTQVKLLRVLQEREFERLGGTETVRVDVRFIAATHRDLEAMVASGMFREDLFYRLSVIPIVLPPLRERRAEIAPLVAHFCKTLGPANAKPRATVEPAAVELIVAQPWPGNVRQLLNFVERLLVLSSGETLTLADVQRELARTQTTTTRTSDPDVPPPPSSGTLEERRREVEREALRSALTHAGGNRALAARVLGVSRRTLFYKLAEYDVT